MHGPIICLFERRMAILQDFCMILEENHARRGIVLQDSVNPSRLAQPCIFNKYALITQIGT